MTDRPSDDNLHDADGSQYTHTNDTGGDVYEDSEGDEHVTYGNEKQGCRWFIFAAPLLLVDAIMLYDMVMWP